MCSKRKEVESIIQGWGESRVFAISLHFQGGDDISRPWTGFIIRMPSQARSVTSRLGEASSLALVVRVSMVQLSSRPRSPKRSSDLGSPTELLDRGGILFCHPKVDILSGLDERSEVG